MNDEVVQVPYVAMESMRARLMRVIRWIVTGWVVSTAALIGVIFYV